MPNANTKPEANGAEQSAILLMALGEEDAAKVFQHLSPTEIQVLGQTMAQLEGIEIDHIHEVINTFIEEVQDKSSLGYGLKGYLKTTLEKALGKDKAGRMMSKIITGSDSTGLDSLKWMDTKSIVDSIKNEHPQIIAIVLASLESQQASSVLELIGDDKFKTDIVRRIATMDSVQPVAIEELKNVLEIQFQENGSSGKASLGGVKCAADIINFIDKPIEDNIMSSLRESDEDLSNQIDEQMFIFENLLNIDDRGMQAILKEVSSDVLIVALKGADEEVKEHVFNNMSKRAAELMKDDLEAKGPVRLSEVEEAQKEILSTVKKLVESGDVMLGGAGGDDFV